MRLTRMPKLAFPLIALVALIGCSQDTGDTDVKIDPVAIKQRDEASLKEVENNPNIPPQQKAAILARMKSRDQLGEAGRKTSGK